MTEIIIKPEETEEKVINATAFIGIFLSEKENGEPLIDMGYNGNLKDLSALFAQLLVEAANHSWGVLGVHLARLQHEEENVEGGEINEEVGNDTDDRKNLN
jgi:hypothetical protein